MTPSDKLTAVLHNPTVRPFSVANPRNSGNPIQAVIKPCEVSRSPPVVFYMAILTSFSYIIYFSQLKRRYCSRVISNGCCMLLLFPVGHKS